MFRHLLAWVALGALLVNGCSVRELKPGAVIATHCVGEGDACLATPNRGDYALYRSGKHWPVVKRNLLPGQPVGFARQSDGQLVAWAGDELIPLKEGDYRWRVLPKAAFPRLNSAIRTTLKTLFVVGCIVTIVGVFILAWCNSDGELDLFTISDEPAAVAAPAPSFDRS